MEHGQPTPCICNKCSTYGLISRFGTRECPDCKGPVIPTTYEALRKLTGKPIQGASFTFHKLK